MENISKINDFALSQPLSRNIAPITDSIDPSSIEYFLFSDKFAVPLDNLINLTKSSSFAFFVKVSPLTRKDLILVNLPSFSSGNFKNRYSEITPVRIESPKYSSLSLFDELLELLWINANSSNEMSLK